MLGLCKVEYPKETQAEVADGENKFHTEKSLALRGFAIGVQLRKTLSKNIHRRYHKIIWLFMALHCYDCISVQFTQQQCDSYDMKLLSENREPS